MCVCVCVFVCVYVCERVEDNMIFENDVLCTNIPRISKVTVIHYSFLRLKCNARVPSFLYHIRFALPPLCSSIKKLYTLLI